MSCRRLVTLFPTGMFCLAALVSSFAESPSRLSSAIPAKAPPNWTFWRGPSGQGYTEDAHVPLTWSDTQNLLWRTALPGQGNSSPIVWGDRIFLTAFGQGGDERYVLCVRAADGQLLWQQLASRGVRDRRTHPWNGYASPSCTTDGTYVYAFFGTPGLFCYDFDGKLIWQHSFGIFTTSTGWGTGASPFLFEDLVIQNCDNDGPAGLPPGTRAEDAAPMALVALDKATGQERWRTPRDQGKGWSTPLLIPTPEGRVDLVLNGPYGVWGYDPRTGKEIWHCERHKGNEKAQFGEPLPAFNQDTLFAASGRPGPMQAIRLGGRGDVTRTHIVWDVVRKGSRDVASPIVAGDYLYAADRYGFLSAHDVKTGRILFRERLGSKPFSASPLRVQGKLLFLMEDGQMFVVEPGPTLNIVGRNRLSDDTEFRASPAVVDGRMYLRSQGHLYCIGAKQ
ncbi:MAG: PQQ-binding-like beta-propeller repeat protein [Gemmataceae bacterium]|nr:PQQ-binding-like beta-propeller repeat protein [Gemmataceae bacterium]